MFKKNLILLSWILTISPFIVLLLFYNQIPQQIPAFLDLKGNPAVWIQKSIPAVLRLPIMGLMIQGLCYTMFFTSREEARIRNEYLWSSVSFSAALKMSLTSVEILFYNNPSLFSWLRNIVFIVILAAVINILVNLYELYKTYQGNFLVYFSAVNNLQKILITLFLTGYLLFVLLPYLIPG